MKAVERRQHGRSVVPRRARRSLGDVVAVARRDRHDDHRRGADGGEIGGDLLRHLVEARALRRGVEGDQIHLVHHHGNLTEAQQRSEEHTSELQSLMRISYAVFCLKKKKKKKTNKAKKLNQTESK